MFLSAAKITVIAIVVVIGDQTEGLEGGDRIIGGSDAIPGQFPWLVSIQRNDRGVNVHHCMGALLDRKHVLTAGHCGSRIVEEPLIMKKYRVILGAHDLRNPNETSQATHKICGFHRHPKFEVKHSWDVGIMTLSKPATYSERIKPIRLIPPGTDPYQLCSVAGWGWHVYKKKRSAEEPVPDILRTINVTIQTYEECTRLHSNIPFPETQICATGPKGELPSTRDNGTPLLCHDADGPYAAAVFIGVSGNMEEYSYYTKISDVLDFILCTKTKRTKG